MSYVPYDKSIACPTDRVAWALCQIIDDDAPLRWTRYRGVVECIAKNPEVMADLEMIAGQGKAAQGGVTEAMVDNELAAKRYIRDWTPDCVRDYVGKLEAALSAEPAAQGEVGVGVDMTTGGAHVCVRLGDTVVHSKFYPSPPAEPAAQGDGDFKNFHRLLCERFGYAHDEKDWRRDQVSLIEWIARQQAARTQFANPEELADWLESLHEAYADGAVGNRKWEPAQVAARAIRGIGQQAARVDDGMATRALEAALSAQPAPDGDAPCAKCGSSSVDTGFECNDCGHDNAPSAQPAERQGEAVAWLHTVTQGDGETDQALSFSPASFLLDTQLGFRSLGCRPLGYIDTHPAGWPRVWGTSRVADNAKCLLVSFEREPTNDELIAFDDAIKAAAPVGVPEGMVLVPIEPTELMASAAHKSLVTFNPTTVRGYPVMQAARECYAAMLAAAPSAPQGEG